MRARYERHAQESKRQRLENERRQVIRARQRVVSKVYMDYKKTLTPMDTISLPSDYDVYQFPPFAQLINVTDTSTLEESDCASPAEQLPVLIMDWAQNRLSALTNLLPEEDRESASHITSVYICGNRQCAHRDLHSISQPTPLFGVGEAVLHSCCDWDWMGMWVIGRRTVFKETVISPSDHGTEAVWALLELLGRNRNDTTPADLDAMDLRLTCSLCPPTHAYLWRTYVCHFASTSRSRIDIIIASGDTLHVASTFRTCMCPAISRDDGKSEAR